MSRRRKIKFRKMKLVTYILMFRKELFNSREYKSYFPKNGANKVRPSLVRRTKKDWLIDDRSTSVDQTGSVYYVGHLEIEEPSTLEALSRRKDQGIMRSLQ